MSDINTVTIMGRLGRDPEITTMQSGDRVANLNIATSDRWKDKNTGEQREKTEWHRVVVFGKPVDIVEKFLRKGLRVHLQGALRTRKWLDQSGADRYSTEIVLSGFGSKITLIDFPDDGGARGQSQGDAYGGLPGNGPPGDSDPSPGGEPAGEFDDEIPFAPQML